MQPIADIIPLVDEFAAGKSRGVPIPCWGKIAAKVVLSRLVRSYAWRRKFGLFRHSYTDRKGRAKPDHVARFLARHRAFGSASCHTVVELGPGDTIANSLYAATNGARRIWLVDRGEFASRDVERYGRLVADIDHGLPGLRSKVDLASRDSLLESIGASYLTGGVASLAQIPDASVDMVFSIAVMEHARLAEFDTLIAETFRILRPGGTAHHSIDLTDHLGGNLNKLRFSPAVWEHPIFSEAGFYTNRRRHSDIIRRFRARGCEVGVDEEELLIATFHLCACKPTDVVGGDGVS
jgi:SAM-dependent methyltransferase